MTLTETESPLATPTRRNHAWASTLLQPNGRVESASVNRAGTRAVRGEVTEPGVEPSESTDGFHLLRADFVRRTKIGNLRRHSGAPRVGPGRLEPYDSGAVRVKRRRMAALHLAASAYKMSQHDRHRGRLAVAERPSSERGSTVSDVRLHLIDGFELRCDGETIRLPLGSQRLVAYLALHSRPLLRIHVAGTLWLDASESRSCANLRSALWRRPGPLERRSSTRRRATSGSAREVEVDVREVIALARGLLDGPGRGRGRRRRRRSSPATCFRTGTTTG